MKEYYICKTSTDALTITNQAVQILVNKGDLIYTDNHKRRDGVKCSLVSRINRDIIILESELQKFDRISEDVFGKFLAIDKLDDRNYVFQHEWGKLDSINVNSEALVKLPVRKEKIRCVIRYKGPTKLGSGTWFGAELLQHYEYGDNNGKYKKKIYFKCEENRGVFVTIAQLFECIQEPGRELTSSSKSQTDMTNNFKVGDYVRVSHTNGDTDDIGQIMILSKGTLCLNAVIKRLKEFTPSVGLLDADGRKPEEIIVAITYIRHIDVDLKKQLEEVLSKTDDVDPIATSPPIPSTGPSLIKKDTSAKWYFTRTLEEAPIPDTYLNLTGLETGSSVEVRFGSRVRFGTLMWSGYDKESVDEDFFLGIELESFINNGTDGKFGARRLFQCAAGLGVLINPQYVSVDSRLIAGPHRKENKPEHARIENRFPCENEEELLPVCHYKEDKSWTGQHRGIQGEKNSCYLDSTLCAMFAFTTAFDYLLNRPKRSRDIEKYDEIQTFLKKAIINPLRKKGLHFVHSQNVMQLRKYFEDAGTMDGIMSDEKDPEEFLNSLFQKVLKVDTFIDYCDSQGTHLYDIILPDKCKFIENGINPSTQQLFYSSLLSSKLCLKKIPNCLIIQFPRCGKDYRKFNHIVPSETIEISTLIKGVYKDISTEDPRYRDRPQMCTSCESSLRTTCCITCADSNISYCDWCWKAHKCSSRRLHKDFPLNIDLQKERSVNLRLFAVLCIERSQYVTFLRDGNNWLFCDSMAHRVGEENIPEVTEIPNRDIHSWLNQVGDKKVGDMSELERRFLCDSYMFFYESTDVRL